TLALLVVILRSFFSFFFFFFSSRRRHTRFSRDWSSDVCSSDLLPWPATQATRTPLPSPYTWTTSARCAWATCWRPKLLPSTWAEIGRASCRERVEISVVAVALKKKGEK